MGAKVVGRGRMQAGGTRQGRRMAEEQIPEAWIGRRVIVVGQDHSIIGELLEVNHRGIAVAYTDTQHQGRYGEFPEEVQADEVRFYPWEQVGVIRYVEQDQNAG